MPMVEIEKPADEELGTWFEALRGWLDRNGSGGVTFVRVGQGGDRPIYRLVFENDAAAEKFSHTFPAYLVGTPRAASAETPEFVAADTLGDALALSAAQGASSRRP
jgi:hypothetical protein